jgi:hypothetical protein
MIDSSTIRTVDSKGRVNVGMALAGSQVIVEEDPSGVVVKPVKAVPAHEAWLWENEAALDAVREGVEQAASGQLSDGPENLKESLEFAESVSDAE